MDAATLDSFTIELNRSSEIGMSVILAVMMLAVALGLKADHFAFFKTQPRHYLAGVFAQIIGLPLLTLCLILIWQPSPSFALGMILVACCPGGNVSNLMALFGKANTALSVSMTATSSLMAAFVTPIAILFWSGLYGPTRDLLTSINFDVAQFLQQTLLILAVPILIGMSVSRYAPRLARALQKPLALVSAFGLFLIIISGIYKYRDIFIGTWALILPLIVVHNAIALLLGDISGRLTRADTPTRRALTFEVGIQNSGLGLVILITQMSGLGGAAAVTATWGIWHLISGSFMVGLYRWVDRRRIKAEAFNV